MDFIDLKSQQKTIRKKIDQRIKAVLDHGKYIMGPEVFELEEKLANYVGSKFCITCASGTDALLMPLMANNIGPGDAVITSPFTYIATAEVISLLGATPIFVDIYSKTFNMDPSKLEEAIKEAQRKNLQPKAIIAVNLFGLPARYRMIQEIANNYNLFIIEDTAQGFGGSIRLKKSGSFGDVASTSFFPAKPLGCYGDGGAIFTDNENLAKKLRSIRVHGSGLDKYDNIRVGINGRLDTIQAAILLEKLSLFDNEVDIRNKNAKYYSNNISSKFRVPHIPLDYISSWAQYSLLAKSSKQRKRTMLRLGENNIPSMIYYKIPLHMQKVYRGLGYSVGNFPIAEDISNKIFSIPMHPYLTIQNQDRIIEVLDSV